MRSNVELSAWRFGRCLRRKAYFPKFVVAKLQRAHQPEFALLRAPYDLKQFGACRIGVFAVAIPKSDGDHITAGHRLFQGESTAGLADVSRFRVLGKKHTLRIETGDFDRDPQIDTFALAAIARNFSAQRFPVRHNIHKIPPGSEVREARSVPETRVVGR